MQSTIKSAPSRGAPGQAAACRSIRQAATAMVSMKKTKSALAENHCLHRNHNQSPTTNNNKATKASKDQQQSNQM